MSTAPPPATTLGRPPAVDLAWLGVAIIFISTSGPIITVIAAPALAIAFWRCFLGSGATGVWVMIRQPRALGGLSRREVKFMVFAGLLLGAHFAAWIPSLRFTTVASSTALVATQPIWAALLARLRGVQIPRQAWFGIVVALVGILILTGIDFTVDPRHLIGDGLALLGGMLAAAYVTVAEQARQSVSTSVTTFGVYASAGALLIVMCLVLRVPLAGYSLRDWLLILALTVGAQLLGHTLINKVLATTSATLVSLAILFEMPGSTLVAAVWLGQIPPLGIIPAVALMFIGLVMVIRSSSVTVPTESPPI
ncbi:MAG: DMT family transporter [Candidatus Nanopelagicales bacterium]|nr:DMT family transporter [Candidatus Nanopelagicales bacterium]